MTLEVRKTLDKKRVKRNKQIFTTWIQMSLDGFAMLCAHQRLFTVANGLTVVFEHLIIY